MSTDQRTRPAIGDYAFLSDCNAAVFVDRWGSVDWWCLPRFDSPSVFGRLLDPDAGHWTLRPDGDDWTISRGYLRDSLVLATTWSRPGAEVRITEALALEPGARGHEIGKRTSHALLRRVEGIRGSVAFCSEFRPRFEYGLNRPRLARDGDLLTAEAGAVSLTLVADVPFEIAEREECATARFVVQPATTLDFRLSYSPAYGPDLRESGTVQSVSVDDTVEGWRSWMEPHQAYHGPYRDLVRRSALVLKGLTYERSGALLAAATTSLPEKLGGEANWDYRLAWLRDASLMMRAQWVAACPEEAERYFAWIARAVGRDHRQTPIVYGVEGERDLTERELPHLAGYRDSRPVRIGNDAWRQTQLDVYGHVLDAACLLRERLGPGPLDEDVSRMLADFADRAAERWMEPDAGMWEARDQDRIYTSSRLMCWLALDRAVELGGDLGDEQQRSRWMHVRDEIRDAILDRAWSQKAGAYAGAFDSDELDAAVLLMPIVGFLPMDEPRMRSTVDAVREGLGKHGLMRRWSGDPSGFLLCSYWLVECMALGGDIRGARALFERTTALGNDLGLLTEEADIDSGEPLGNVPQAFSHAGLINAAWRIGEHEDSA